MKCLHDRGEDEELSLIKKGAQYFYIGTSKFLFNDTLHFTSPCNYSAYLRQWGASEEKSIFPYSLYSSVEELEAATEFPSHQDFYSTLTDSNVSLEDYNRSRSEFYRRKNLPTGHSDKMFNMRCWLSWYNMLDVQPLVEAMERSFKCFHDYFEQDANTFLSLPGVAQKALYRCYDQTCSYIFGFRAVNDDIRSMHRRTLCGGLVNVFHRHIDIQVN